MSDRSKSAAAIFDASETIFSENKKISPRQIRRALTLEIFGISSLILPSHLASQSGIFGVLALAAGAVGAGAMTYLWDRFYDGGSSQGIETTGDAGGSGKEKPASGKLLLRNIVLIPGGCGLLDLASCV